MGTPWGTRDTSAPPDAGLAALEEPSAIKVIYTKQPMLRVWDFLNPNGKPRAFQFGPWFGLK